DLIAEQTAFMGDLYSVTTKDGSETHRYRIYAGGTEVANVVRDVSGASVTSEHVTYLHGDLLGSNVFESDAQGVSAARRFQAFGKLESGGDALNTTTPGFTGHRHETDLGLIDMKGRFYDPTIGRFLSPDPFIADAYSPQSYNGYTYVRNSPL